LLLTLIQAVFLRTSPTEELLPLPGTCQNG
jgi:hypothetical protein